MKYVWLLVLLVVAAGCDEDPVAPQGSIAGFVSLISERGDRYADRSGVKIMLRGSSHSAMSDADGKWQLDGVPAGIYDLEYSKPGFGTSYLRAFQFVGGGTAYMTSVPELVRARRDTMILTSATLAPEYQIRLSDTLVFTDTGWMRPYDTVEVADRFVRLEGDVTFEDETVQTSPIYLRPYFTNLSVVPSNNYEVGRIVRGKNVVLIDVQQPIQHGYPRGVPTELIFTTRQNNTWYFEPSTRERLVTDPYDLIRVTVTLPQD